MKFSGTGTRLWATNYGGLGTNPADLDICPSSGKIYGFGESFADTAIATSDGFQQSRLNNDYAGFFAEFSPGLGGTRTYGTFLGRGNILYGHMFGQHGYNLSCSRFGIAYITAKTAGTGNFATSNAFQTVSMAGSSNVPFMIAVTTDTVVHTRFPFTDTLWCPGDTVKILYKVNTEFLSGNTFTVQLSNASGSFASPVNIGTHSSVTSDTIFCVVPPDMPPGNNYRIRITSTAPVRLSLDNDENIRIKANPINFSASSANLACTGDTIKLNSSSTSSGMSWLWTGPGGFTSGAKDTMITPVVTGNAGQYILKGTLNSTGCSLYDTVDITVRPTPDKPVASSNGPVCETFMLQLSSASQTSGVTYTWSGPNAYTSNTQNPVISNAAVLGLSGNYISTVELNGCFNRDTVSVTVKPKPAKPFASAVNSPLCARQTLQLNASTVTSTGYSWYGPNGFAVNTQNPTREYMQFSDSGKYYVYATLNGCNSDTDSVRVVVNTDPIVNIFPTPGATICKGEQATFTAIPTNGGSVGYQWYVNGAATGVFTTAYSTTTLNNNDLVYVLMSSNGTCATTFIDTSNYITMNVLPLKGPSVSVAADAGPSLFPNEPINFTATATDAGSSPQYQWRRNGKDISGATGAVWGANANFLNDGDEICVKVTSNYSCPDPDTANSNCIKLNIRLSVSEINGNASIKVYPNPVRDVLHVSADGEVTATLYDVLGRTMTQAIWSGNSMNVSMIPPGNYVLKVTDVHGATGYYKIVKE